MTHETDFLAAYRQARTLETLACILENFAERHKTPPVIAYVHPMLKVPITRECLQLAKKNEEVNMVYFPVFIGRTAVTVSGELHVDGLLCVVHSANGTIKEEITL